MKPEYTWPYAFVHGTEISSRFESTLSEEFVEIVTGSNIIAGWDKDASLGWNGVELQSNILDMSKLPALQRIVGGIPEYGENAGGHIHVARTPNQCASRWYWALRGLDAAQCRLLNMRHIDDDYWCSLTHGEYVGKHTAVNDDMRIPSNCARSTVGMRARPISSRRRSSGKRAPCLIHFRFATHGAVEPRNCHPFHTDRGYVAHNGIAHDYTVGPHASDSRNMVAAWVDSGYDNTVFNGQGLVALITPPMAV